MFPEMGVFRGEKGVLEQAWNLGQGCQAPVFPVELGDHPAVVGVDGGRQGRPIVPDGHQVGVGHGQTSAGPHQDQADGQ